MVTLDELPKPKNVSELVVSCGFNLEIILWIFANVSQNKIEQYRLKGYEN